MYTGLYTCLLSFLCISGCAVQWNAPAMAVSLEEVDSPVDIHVGLYMSEDWRNATSQTETRAINGVEGLGNNLIVNAEQIAQTAFREYTLLSEPTLDPTSNLDAVIEPILLLFDNSVGAIAWGEANDTIQIQWRAYDPSGDVVWIRTVQGDGTGKTGTAFSYIEERENRIAQMLDEAFAESLREIASSSELRSLE